MTLRSEAPTVLGSAFMSGFLMCAGANYLENRYVGYETILHKSIGTGILFVGLVIPYFVGSFYIFRVNLY
jgi:hypothetical protein